MRHKLGSVRLQRPLSYNLPRLLLPDWLRWLWRQCEKRLRPLLGDAHIEKQGLADNRLYLIRPIGLADEERRLRLCAGEQPLGICRYEDDRYREPLQDFI